MLEITIMIPEQWDESKQEFISPREQTLRLEHSLVSLSKWESKHHKPFYSKTGLNVMETIDYIKCMTLTQNVDSNVYDFINNSHVEQVKKYIDDPMTATTFNERNKGRNSSEQITAEIIYYSMIALNIPFECQKWHLNRLLTLIKVCNIKNTPPKKMGKRELMSRNRALNEARKKQFSTKG